MPISFETYQRVALEDDEQWELVCGHLRKKPSMTFQHDSVMARLASQLNRQLDPDEYEVRVNSGRLRISNSSYYVADLLVVSTEAIRRAEGPQPAALGVLNEPVPLVVEVWSPSTGDYDVETKLAEYQLRKDAEIWRLHPYEKTLVTWRLQPDGSYSRIEWREQTITPIALPGVRIDIPRLFRR